jgi:hypothetical protein
VWPGHRPGETSHGDRESGGQALIGRGVARPCLRGRLAQQKIDALMKRFEEDR